MVSEDGDSIEGVKKALKTTELEADEAYAHVNFMSPILVIFALMFCVLTICEIALLVYGILILEGDAGTQLIIKSKFSTGL